MSRSRKSGPDSPAAALQALRARLPGPLRKFPPCALVGATLAGAGLLAVLLLCIRETIYAERIAAVNRAYPRTLSPNRGERPWFCPVSCVVLHATASTSFPSTVRVLTSPRTKVSAHFLVGKDGRVVQLVPIQERAWHAGESRLNDESGVNDFSIGIEIMNRNDGDDPYTEAQYRAVAEIIRRVRTCYTIPDDRIVSHARIARPLGRKSDPRGFAFDRLHRLLRQAKP